MATLKDCYDDVIKNLDFNEIQRVMNFLGWTYHENKNTPTVEELKQVCKDLFNNGCQHLLENGGECVTTCSGGFKVFIGKTIESDKTVWTCSIDFVTNDWCTDTNQLQWEQKK